MINSFSEHESIKNAKYQIQQIVEYKDFDTPDHPIQYFLTGAISKNLKYVVSGGGDKLIKIWNYNTYVRKKFIKLDSTIFVCKFTDDCQFLYIGVRKRIYQFHVNNYFKQLCKQKIHEMYINNIQFITNKIILTSSCKNIIKTDFQKKQQLLIIQTHQILCGLDYNYGLNVIASASFNKSISLWNGINGSLIIEKLNAHNNSKTICQVIFILNNNQLVSLDVEGNSIIWNTNYLTQQLEQLQFINCSGYNISLVLQQQYILTIGKRFIKVYSIKGQFVREFVHQVEDFWQFSTNQLDSLKAIIIQGKNILQVCKIYMD